MRMLDMLGAMGVMAQRCTVLSAGAAGGAQAAPGNGVSRVAGTWRLESYTTGGKASPIRGPHPTGMVHYGANGCMAVQIMPDRPRPRYAGTSPTPDEARAAIIGYTAYFGTYSVDERARTVTHHRIANIIPGGLEDLVRRFELFSDDRLVLMPVETANENDVLVWERIG